MQRASGHRRVIWIVFAALHATVRTSVERIEIAGGHESSLLGRAGCFNALGLCLFACGVATVFIGAAKEAVRCCKCFTFEVGGGAGIHTVDIEFLAALVIDTLAGGDTACIDAQANEEDADALRFAVGCSAPWLSTGACIDFTCFKVSYRCLHIGRSTTVIEAGRIAGGLTLGRTLRDTDTFVHGLVGDGEWTQAEHTCE